MHVLNLLCTASSKITWRLEKQPAYERVSVWVDRTLKSCNLKHQTPMGLVNDNPDGLPQLLSSFNSRTFSLEMGGTAWIITQENSAWDYEFSPLPPWTYWFLTLKKRQGPQSLWFILHQFLTITNQNKLICDCLKQNFFLPTVSIDVLKWPGFLRHLLISAVIFKIAHSLLRKHLSKLRPETNYIIFQATLAVSQLWPNCTICLLEAGK